MKTQVRRERITGVGFLREQEGLHMLPTWGLMFARKKDCLSIVTGGKEEDLETNVGIGRFWRWKVRGVLI